MCSACRKSRGISPRWRAARARTRSRSWRASSRATRCFSRRPWTCPDKRGRRRFGNLVLTRLAAGRVLRHQLPWPAAPDKESMPRTVVEVVVEAPFGALRVMTTHLEYYASEHRVAQIARLRELHIEACGEHLRVDEPGSYEWYERGTQAIVCGDFNLKHDGPEHRQMLDAGFVDAWQALNPGKPRAADVSCARRRAAVLLRLRVRHPGARAAPALVSHRRRDAGFGSSTRDGGTCLR